MNSYTITAKVGNMREGITWLRYTAEGFMSERYDFAPYFDINDAMAAFDGVATADYLLGDGFAPGQTVVLHLDGYCEDKDLNERILTKAVEL